MHSECIERILTAFLLKWTNKSCNLRAHIYIYIYIWYPPKKNKDQKATQNRQHIANTSKSDVNIVFFLGGVPYIYIDLSALWCIDMYRLDC